MEAILLQLFVFFAAAAIMVPIAKRLGLGSVLGYLIAGIIIGPYGLSLMGQVDEIMHITEFGVVMMLFLVGLELNPAMLMKMRVPILGTGGMQVLVTGGVFFSMGLFFLPWQQALAVGLTLSLSSTAIVLQTLREKGQMDTSAGQSVFSVLLFQDLAVIPMLALFPLLATLEVHQDSHAERTLIDLSHYPDYLQLLFTLLAIVLVFVIGRYLSRPVFRVIASTGIREVFVGAALALVVGISLLMTVVGLSPALGTFLAGVVLADSEYRHELESDIEPFKGLLLGIFFISIGASLDFALIVDHIGLIAAITAVLIGAKVAVLQIVSHVFGMVKEERRFFSIALAQGGEFAFVLFQFTRANGILSDEVIAPLVSAVAISMFLTPIMMAVYESVSKGFTEASQREPDTIEASGQKVIMAGLGAMGIELGRFFLSLGIKPVIIDNDPLNVDILKDYGFEVFYGDITRLDLLEAAGAREADLLVVTIHDVAVAKKLIGLVQKHYPNLEISASASIILNAFELMDLGVEHIRRESFGTAMDMGMDALKILGMSADEAYRMTQLFRKHDAATAPKLYKIHREDQKQFRSNVNQHTKLLEELMMTGTGALAEDADQAWHVNDTL